MTKSVLVIETPKDCTYCPAHHVMIGNRITHWCCGEKYINTVDEIAVKPEWCPLKPMPDKKKVDEEYFNAIADDDLKFGHLQWEVYKMGWNACLDEIEGE